MPKAMLEMEKELDKFLPIYYSGKTQKEINEIKWGILRKHGFKPSKEKAEK